MSPCAFVCVPLSANHSNPITNVYVTTAMLMRECVCQCGLVCVGAHVPVHVCVCVFLHLHVSGFVCADCIGLMTFSFSSAIYSLICLSLFLTIGHPACVCEKHGTLKRQCKIIHAPLSLLSYGAVLVYAFAYLHVCICVCASVHGCVHVHVYLWVYVCGCASTAGRRAHHQHVRDVYPSVLFDCKLMLHFQFK